MPDIKRRPRPNPELAVFPAKGDAESAIRPPQGSNGEPVAEGVAGVPGRVAVAPIDCASKRLAFGCYLGQEVPSTSFGDHVSWIQMLQINNQALNYLNAGTHDHALTYINPTSILQRWAAARSMPSFKDVFM